MRFYSLVFKNLFRRRFRTLLTLSALATAIAAVVSLLGIARGFTNSFADVYRSHAIDLVVSRQGSADRLSSSVDEDAIAKIAGLPQVDRTAGVLLDTLSLEEQAVYGIPTMGIANDSWMLAEYKLTDGQGLKADQPKSVLLGIHLAERLQAKSGSEIILFDESYQVAGVFESSSTWENGSMILPLAQLQQLIDRRGQVTYVNVVLKRPQSTNTAHEVIEEIEQLDSKLLALATEDFVNTDTRMQLAGAMAWMTSAIALFIGAIGTLNTMMTSVLERTREIGILRAIGWPRGRIVWMILAESCTMAVVASIIGILLAVVATWALSQAPQAKGILSPVIDSTVLLQGVVLAFLIGLVGALLPAWRAAMLRPVEAFREA